MKLGWVPSMLDHPTEDPGLEIGMAMGAALGKEIGPDLESDLFPQSLHGLDSGGQLITSGQATGQLEPDGGGKDDSLGLAQVNSPHHATGMPLTAKCMNKASVGLGIHLDAHPLSLSDQGLDLLDHAPSRCCCAQMPITPSVRIDPGLEVGEECLSGAMIIGILSGSVGPENPIHDSGRRLDGRKDLIRHLHDLGKSTHG